MIEAPFAYPTAIGNDKKGTAKRPLRRELKNATDDMTMLGKKRLCPFA